MITLQATPLDLLNVIEQKRAREHIMGGLRPPGGGASQGTADYFVPGPGPPASSSEQAANGENDAENEYGEQLQLPYYMGLGLIDYFV